MSAFKRVANKKKVLHLTTESSQKVKHILWLLMGQICCTNFPAKRLSIFWPQTRHHSKAQTFFSKDNFPAKRLSFFPPTFQGVSFKSAIYRYARKILPPKELRFFPLFPGGFERPNSCNRRQNCCKKTYLFRCRCF